MKSIRFCVVPIILFLFAMSGCNKDDNPLSSADNIPSYLTGRVIDSQGKPVEGCGLHYIYSMTSSSLAKVGKTCPSTSINFTIVKRSKVSLKLFRYFTRDSIATIVDDTLDAGMHSVMFDASKLTNGIYVYQLKADTLVQEKNLALMNNDITTLVNTNPLITTNSSGSFSLPYGIFGFGVPFNRASIPGSQIDSVVYISHIIQIVLYKVGYLATTNTITIDETKGMSQTFTISKQ